jgi:3-hydroxyacyl-CoA dehydrogenase
LRLSIFLAAQISRNEAGMRISRVGVVGAGAMGTGIAALAASAGFPVVLLDIPDATDRDGRARGAVDKALKSRTPVFMDPACAARIAVGNTEDHLNRLRDCNWIIEAIIERPDPKRELFARIEPLLQPDAIVTSNTSGIPIHTLAEGRGERFRQRFLGTLLQPVRQLHARVDPHRWYIARSSRSSATLPSGCLERA